MEQSQMINEYIEGLLSIWTISGFTWLYLLARGNNS